MSASSKHYFPSVFLLLLSFGTASAQVSFKSESNLVLVPVVVRDAAGNAVGSLHKENFELFDNGKAQAIASFTVEETSGRIANDRSLGAATEAPMVIPDRFVALLFDDLHLVDAADLYYVRRAALKLAGTLKPTDRVAVFTASGPLAVDFTSDRTKLDQALTKLQKGAPEAFAMMSLEERTREVIERNDEIIRRMSKLPGHRSIVLISPGLPLKGDHWTCVPETRRLIDNAIRSRVIIDGIDARGLTVEHNEGIREFQERVSDGTGGKFIRDTNDLDGAMRTLAATPQYIYVLGFAPDDSTADSSFHRLAVKVREGRKLQVEARRGYWAEGTAS